MPVSTETVPYKHVIPKRWNSLAVIYMYAMHVYQHHRVKKSTKVVINREDVIDKHFQVQRKW